LPERIKLVWCVRDVMLVKAFNDTLELILHHFSQDHDTLANLPIQNQMHISVQIHLTTGSGSKSPESKEGGGGDESGLLSGGESDSKGGEVSNSSSSIHTVLTYEIATLTIDGRPNIRAEVMDTLHISKGGDEKGACVYVCGPESLMEDCQEQSQDLRIPFFHETFEL